MHGCSVNTSFWTSRCDPRVSSPTWLGLAWLGMGSEMAPGLRESCQAQSMSLWAAKRQSILSSVLYTFPTCLLLNKSSLVLAMSILVPSKDSKSRSGSLSNSPLLPKADGTAVTNLDQQGLFLPFSFFPQSGLEMPLVTDRICLLFTFPQAFQGMWPQGLHSSRRVPTVRILPCGHPRKPTVAVVAGNQGVVYQTFSRGE